MSLFMLDTNAASDAVRHPDGPIAKRLAKLDESKVCASAIVTSELWFGVEKRGSAALREGVETLLRTIKVEPFQPPADMIYGTLRSQLARQGEIIGPNDLFIAAHALALDAVLVTDNVKEFSRVPGLKIENWLRG